MEIRWKLMEIRWKLIEIRWKLMEIRWKLIEIRWKFVEIHRNSGIFHKTPKLVYTFLLNACISFFKTQRTRSTQSFSNFKVQRLMIIRKLK